MQTHDKGGSTRIIAFTGRKSSGKDSCAKFLVRNASELFGENYDVRAKVYHFADPLKQFCVDYLDIPKELVFGDETAKQTLTHLLWEKMPHYHEIQENVCLRIRNEFSGEQQDEYTLRFEELYTKYVPTGPMTVREVLQQLGTEVFRRMYGPIWVNKLLRNIKEDSADVAVIADLRFPDEADAVLAAGGEVYRLTRTITDQDVHPSEISMDGYSRLTGVLNNDIMTLQEQNQALAKMFQNSHEGV